MVLCGLALASACRPPANTAVPWVLLGGQLGRSVTTPSGATTRVRARRTRLHVQLDNDGLARALRMRPRALCKRGAARSRARPEDAPRLVLVGRARWIDAPPEGAPSVLSVALAPAGDAIATARGDVVVEPDVPTPIALELPWSLAGHPCACEAVCASRFSLDSRWFHGVAGHLELRWYVVADGEERLPIALGPDAVTVGLESVLEEPR